MAELLEGITARELTEWMAYARLEPFGELRADLRAGIVAATTANVHRGRRQRPLKPEDFMPYAKAERARQRNHKSLSARLRAAFSQMKG